MLVDAIPLRESGRRLSADELRALAPRRGLLRVDPGGEWMFARLLYTGPGWPIGGGMDLLPPLTDVRLVRIGAEGIVIGGYVSQASDGRVMRGDRQGWWCKPVAPDAPVSRFEPRGGSSPR